MSGAPERVLIYVASGRQGLFDQLGPDAELFERVAGQLLPRRTAAVRFDCDGFHPTRSVSDDRRLAARADRLADVIERVRREFDCPITLMGLSLGGLAICDMLARSVLPSLADTLVLCSTCIDRPLALMPTVREVRLIYGAFDGVGYANAADACQRVDAPSAYGPRCRDNLIVMSRTQVTLEVLAHVGHLLLRPGAHAPDDDTVAHLVSRAAPASEAQYQMEMSE